MALTPGTRLGPYEIVAAIGAGGMGEVYRARDARLGRNVAIKVLPSHLAANADFRQRFEREAKAVAALSHPNILAIHDVGVDGDIAYSVTELLEGETLRARLESGALQPRKAVDYALQMAHGLAAAHSRGVIHRDLKPENLFVTQDGRIKILDFGLAKWAEPEGSLQTQAPTLEPGTSPGAVLGTVGYMSPEQVRGQSVDARSDVFSLGTILYEMLAGTRAFKGPSAADTLSAILREDPPELARSGQSVPPGLERIVQHCLEKSPEQRFQSARDLAFGLESHADLSTPSGTVASIAAGGRGDAQRRGLRLAAGLALAAGVAAAMFFLGLRAGGTSRVAHVAFHVLSYRPQMIFRAAFAPDGKTIVYSAALNGNEPHLYTRSADYPEPRELPIESAQLLAVSSKGELALLLRAQYVGHRLFEGTLARMPLGGGAPREILEGVREAAWAPDAEGLAIIRSQSGKDRLEFPVGTVLCETSGYFSDLRFAPDGRHIAFFQHPAAFDDRGGIAVVEIATKKTTLLADGFWGEEGLAWSVDGREILFSAGLSYASFSVHAVTLAGKQRVALESAGGLVIQDVAADGRWLATRDDIRKDLRIQVAGSAERDLSWLDQSDGAALSADGNMLLFSEQSGQMGLNYAVCLRPADGGAVVRLGEGWAADLSPDGKWAIGIVPTSPNRLVLYPTGAGQPQPLDSGGVAEYTTARWFPDGKRLLLVGSEPGRAARAYVQDIAGGKSMPLTDEDIAEAYVAPDGASIATQSGDGAYAIYPARGGTPHQLGAGNPGELLVGWSKDGTALLVQTPTEVPGRLVRLDVATGRRDLLRSFAPTDLVGVMRVRVATQRDDGATLVFTVFRQESTLFRIDGAR